MRLAEIKQILYRTINKLSYAVKSIQRNKLKRLYSGKLTDNRRYDFFIIWGHGLKHRKEIVDMIRNNKFLEIKMMIFYKIKSMRRFIKKIYGYDSAPLIYLRFKTKYLLNVNPNVYIIFVLNKNPQEVFFGKKPFRHVQCINIKKIKDEIRDKFNPRENGKRTENHVIHASDEQFQVDLLLRSLGFVNGIHHFERKSNPFLSLPYYISSFSSFRIKKINLTQLYGHVLKGDVNNFTTEVCSLEKSPHYKYLTGDKKVYQKYLETFEGYFLTDDYSVEKFDGLFQNSFYLQSPYDTSYILTEEFCPNKYVILDGLHRASKLLFLKQKELIVAVREPNSGLVKTISQYLLDKKDYLKNWMIRLKKQPKRLLKSFGITRSFLLDGKTLKSSLNTKEYIMSSTCQIPNLSAIYKQYFGFCRNGTFVEIGAFDGEYASNTSILADIGWSGFYVEPVPKFFKLCRKRHEKNKRTEVFRCAIGDTEEVKTMYLGGHLSTINLKMVNIFKRIDWGKSYFQKEEEIEVKQTTLKSFLSLSNVPKNFELLVIDVEGYEWNVLKNFDIQKWAPKMVIIELHDQNSNYLPLREECNQIVDYFKKNKYKVIHKDLSNTVYVRSDFYLIDKIERKLI